MMSGWSMKSAKIRGGEHTMPLTNMNHVQSVFIPGLACVCIKYLSVWDEAVA